MDDSETTRDRLTARWLSRLEVARGKCLAVYEQTTARRGLARLGSDAVFGDLAAEMYAVISDEVYRLLREVWSGPTLEGAGFPQERRQEGFFYWPGYLRYATARPGRLDVLRREAEQDFCSFDGTTFLAHVADQALDGAGFFRNAAGLSKASYLPLSIWMHLLYGRRLGSFVLHGFTRWISVNGEPFVWAEEEKSEESPLVAVEFAWREEGPPSVQSGVLRCPLPAAGGPRALQRAIELGLNESGLVRFGASRVLPRVSFPPYSVQLSKGETAERVDEGVSAARTEDIERLAADLVAILFGSMFVNCDSWKSGFTQEDGEAPALLRFILETQKECRRRDLRELEQALTLGVEATKGLPAAACGHIFSFYYAIPLPRSMKIEGFHKIEGDLGSINLYTTQRIPAVLLQVLRIWFHRIYEDLRLLEIASDAEQSGLRTAAGAFQHELKQLASAIGNQWVVPATKLFHLRTTIRDTEQWGNDRVGVIEIKREHKWLCEDLGVAPFREVLDSMVSLLRLWTLSESVEDLPFRLGRVMHVGGFVRKCMEAAQRALEPHALSYLSAENPQQLENFRRVRSVLAELRRRQLRALKIDVDRMFLVRQEEKAVWLARLLIGVLKNAVQHGSPLEGIRFSLRSVAGGRKRLTVRNKGFDYDEVRAGIEEGLLGDEAAMRAVALAVALNAVTQGATEFDAAARNFWRFTGNERAIFKSGDVIDACLVRLNGESIYRDFEEGPGGFYRSECEFDY